MPEPDIELPTKSEMQILRVIWSLGEPTVREVYDFIREHRDINRPVVSTHISTMLAKGILVEVATARPHRVRAAHNRADVAQAMLANLADQVFDGSISDLVLHAVKDLDLPADELDAMVARIKQSGPPK